MSNAQSSRRYLIAGNWKMYKTVAEAKEFTRTLYDQIREEESLLPDIVLCPPTIALDAVVHAIEKTLGGAPFSVGAQTMESHDEGAYTGETSPKMLADLEVEYVVIGHSERRQYYNEVDETVNAKTKAALAHQLTPIVCVGESLEQRESGQTDTVVTSQVEAALQGIAASDFEKLVFAYEPVWAIGTGKTCEADEANRVCALIRQTIGKKGSAEQTRILYGGSVKPENSDQLLGQSDIDGALVGGASLKTDSFSAIITAAVNQKKGAVVSA